MDDIPEPSTRRLLTIGEAAQRLGCSEANMYSLIKSGKVPYIVIGQRKGYRIDQVDLDLFIQSRKEQKTAAPVRLPRPKLKHIRLN